jgi:hypothetical protein
MEVTTKSLPECHNSMQITKLSAYTKYMVKYFENFQKIFLDLPYAISKPSRVTDPLRSQIYLVNNPLQS